MTIKATKTSACEVSITLNEAVEIIRHELNIHGSREAGANIAIPPHASFFIVSDETDSNKRTLVFRWNE